MMNRIGVLLLTTASVWASGGGTLVPREAAAQFLSADLSVSVAAAPEPVTVGRNLTYTVTVTNAGPGTATGVMLLDSLPRSVTFVNATTTQGSCSPPTNSSSVTCELGTLSSGATATVTIVVTAIVAGQLTNNSPLVGSPTADPNSSNNFMTVLTTVVEPSPLAEFIRAFYTTILAREPAPVEVDAWVTFLVANPEHADSIVQGFFHSSEFLHTRQGRLADYITLLYATVLGRLPASAEVDAWLPLVVDRLNRIVPGFVDSPEFQGLLQTTPPATIIRRLYQHVLGREPAAAEVDAWVRELDRTGSWLGVSLGFLNSPEYLGGSRTFSDHIVILYHTFLERTPAASEVDAWLTIVAELLTEIEDGFVDSPEFQALLDTLL